MRISINSVSKKVNIDLESHIGRLAEHKKNAMKLAKTYLKTDLPWKKDRSLLLQECGKRVVLALNPDTKKWGVAQAMFCQRRLCPVCAWRRSVKTFANIYAIITSPDFLKLEPDFIFITLTKKNVLEAELSGELDRQLEAWRILNSDKRQPFRKSFLGTFRSLEVTYNKSKKTYHVHIHALAAVKPGYFKKNNPDYIGFEHLQELWRDALNRAVKIVPVETVLRQLPTDSLSVRLKLGPTLMSVEKSIREKYPEVDYLPIVRIQKVKSGTHKGVAEVAKYTVKPGDYIDNHKVVKTLDIALRRRRLIAYGGVFRDLHLKLGLSDERVVEDDISGETAVSVMKNPLIQKIVAEWDFSQGAYKITPYK